MAHSQEATRRAVLGEERRRRLLGSATGRIVQITPRGSGPPEPSHTKLHIAVTSIDEVQFLATLRISGHHHCADRTRKNRVLLVAVASDDADADGCRPSASVTLAPSDVQATETVRLPLCACS